MTFIAVYLFVQNMQLNKKLEQYATAPVKPAMNAVKPANPPGASPFDKPNNDPLANEFIPPASKPLPLTKLDFETVSYDFGRINEGDRVNTTFKFKNAGPNALLISSALASCGCTVPTWSRRPIPAGEKGDMLVQFDSQGKQGEVTKTVNVTANTQPPITVLTIKATVIPRDK